MAAFSNPDATTPMATGVNDTNLKASVNKRHFQWKTASGVCVLTLAVFAADFVFLGQSGEPQFSCPGFSATLWNYANNFTQQTSTLDCSIFVCLLSLLVVKFGYCRFGAGSKADVVKRAALATSDNAKFNKARRGEEISQPRCPKCGRRQCNCKVPSVFPRAGDSDLADGTAAKWNKAIDRAARGLDAGKAGCLLVEFEQTSDGKPGNCPDNVSYNLVIRGCAKRGDWRGAEQWLAHMETKGVEATTCTYNTLLDACAKADRAEACETWLQTMLDKGVEANLISYATTIYAWARRGEEAVAAAWLQKMEAAGIAPDTVSYNSLIHACGVNGNAAGAERWLEKMQSAGLEATVTSYTSVMDAAAKAGDIPTAEKWLEAMIESKLKPNVVSFCAMIDACAKKSNVVRAEYWHNRMLDCGIQANAHSCSAVINACSKAGDVERAEEWLERSHTMGVPHDVVVYSGVIDACSKAGDAERAMAIFKRIQANGLRPHVVAYAALARPYAYRGDFETVESIAEDMATNGIKSNEYFLYAQLLSYATARPREAERAEECLRKALRCGLQANDHVVGALCRAVGRDHAVALMDELCNGRSVPLQCQLPGSGSGRTRVHSKMRV